MPPTVRNRPEPGLRLTAAAAVLLLGACAQTMEVRPLATARVEQAAFELTGADLDALRREAQRLCPQGGEVLRQAGADQRFEQIDGRMRRWWNTSVAWVDPPRRSAQLVVLCHEATGRHLLASAAAAASAAEAAEPPPAAPVGPIAVEW